MKSKILILAIVLLVVFLFISVFAVQSSNIVGEDGLIAKARKEINNLAEVETIEMTIAGKSTIDSNRHLFWIVTGNEYQIEVDKRIVSVYIIKKLTTTDKLFF